MGFKRPLVQLQSLGPTKNSHHTVMAVFYWFQALEPAASCKSNPPLGLPNAQQVFEQDASVSPE